MPEITGTLVGAGVCGADDSYLAIREDGDRYRVGCTREQANNAAETMMGTTRTWSVKLTHRRLVLDPERCTTCASPSGDNCEDCGARDERPC